MTCQEIARDAVIVAGLIGGAVGFGLGNVVAYVGTQRGIRRFFDERKVR